MQIATKSRLAVTAMLDLALRHGHGPIALSAIGAGQRASLSYLEVLFARLRRQGLVRSTRGPGGGYGLARSAADITVADIVLAIDEPQQPCARAKNPPSGTDHPAGHRIASDWCTDLERMITQHLASVSLQDLVESQSRLRDDTSAGTLTCRAVKQHPHSKPSTPCCTTADVGNRTGVQRPGANGPAPYGVITIPAGAGHGPHRARRACTAAGSVDNDQSSAAKP